MATWPTLDVADIAGRGHQVEKINDIERGWYPKGNVMHTRPIAVCKRHVVYTTFTMHPGGPQFFAFFIFRVFGYAKTEITIKCYRGINVGRKTIKVINTQRLYSVVQRVFLMNRLEPVHLVIELKRYAHVVRCQ